MRAITMSSLFGTIVAGILVYVFRRTDAPLVPAGVRSLATWLAAAALVVFLVNQARHFVDWWSAPQHSLEYANADLQEILSDDAVLTGGYGTPLAQGAELENFPAMFGVSEVDRKFFQKFPVTHVAEVDDQNQSFVKNYPNIANNAERVATYTIRNLPVTVFRVAELGGNTTAMQYPLSAFESFRQRVAGDSLDALLRYLPDWIADSGNHFTGWRWLGDTYTRANRLDEAIDAYEHAASFYPDDFFLWAQIGDVSWQYYRTGGDSQFGDRAVEAWSHALALNPENPQLLARLSRANGP
jgi:tetratricopeptide (TPR) repeat protein